MPAQSDQREIIVSIRTSYDFKADTGKAIRVIEFHGRRTTLFDTFEASSPKRMILIEMIRAVQSFKEPFHIIFNVECNFGFKYLTDQRKWENRDVGNTFLDLIEQGGHTYELRDSSFYEGGKALQKWLGNTLKQHS
ncbi:hypothetical protein ACRPK8_07445 [Exiguobacterium sp. TDN 0502]|uniref:hypothetical protein n=1 Tax=Exiguobacterium sp. TDN 0502 TaxID=3420731 RepID=UPI003D78B0F2